MQVGARIEGSGPPAEPQAFLAAGAGDHCEGEGGVEGAGGFGGEPGVGEDAGEAGEGEEDVAGAAAVAEFFLDREGVAAGLLAGGEVAELGADHREVLELDALVKAVGGVAGQRERFQQRRFRFREPPAALEEEGEAGEGDGLGAGVAVVAVDVAGLAVGALGVVEGAAPGRSPRSRNAEIASRYRRSASAASPR